MDHSKSRKLSKIKKNIFTTHRSHFFYFQKWRNFRKGVGILRTCQVRHIANMMGPHKACLKLLWEACKHVQVAKLRKKFFWAQENCKRVPKICAKLKHLRLMHPCQVSLPTRWYFKVCTSLSKSSIWVNNATWAALSAKPPEGWLAPSPNRCTAPRKRNRPASLGGHDYLS